MLLVNCFQWFKDTKMKANHNPVPVRISTNGNCFQWFKDTKMKANHNGRLLPSHAPGTVSNGSKILK